MRLPQKYQDLIGLLEGPCSCRHGRKGNLPGIASRANGHGRKRRPADTRRTRLSGSRASCRDEARLAVVVMSMSRAECSITHGDVAAPVFAGRHASGPANDVVAPEDLRACLRAIRGGHAMSAAIRLDEMLAE